MHVHHTHVHHALFKLSLHMYITQREFPNRLQMAPKIKQFCVNHCSLHTKLISQFADLGVKHCTCDKNLLQFNNNCHPPKTLPAG